MMSVQHGIPAANFISIDLDAIAEHSPVQAREIARLDGLMRRGAETKEDGRSLCMLLHNVGESREAEFLLRRNLRHYEGQDLYQRLFGTRIPDNFERAIKHFAEEFGLDLALRKERNFLDQEYLSTPLSGKYPRFNILNEKCVVRFDYSQRDFVVVEINAAKAATVNYFDLNTCLFLRWQDSQWRLLDPREA
jgi:hypothetical protein